MNGPLCQGTLLGTQETKDVILTEFQAQTLRSQAAQGGTATHSGGGDATFVSICPSGRQAQSCLRPDGWPVPLLLFFFSCVPGSGFGSFHQRLKPRPPPSPVTSQGPRAGPGAWATVNKAARGPLGAASLPRQALSPGWPEPGPRSPLLQEARV